MGRKRNSISFKLCISVQAKDTVDFPINNADYKIVAYVDSVGCMSCKLQLPRWKDFISEIDSLTGHFIPFVFYFHPKDIKDYAI